MIRNTRTDEASDTEIIKTPVRLKDKTGLCIGSIFGMDAGGTLTKLVYFEQRNIRNVDHLHMPTEDVALGKPLHMRRTTSADLWPLPSSLKEEESESRFRRESLPNLGQKKADQISLLPSLSETDEDEPGEAPRKSRPIFELNKSRLTPKPWRVSYIQFCSKVFLASSQESETSI
jgi:hypothetical protein